MKYEAIKHQGVRTDLTSGQVGPKPLRSLEQLAAAAGESAKQVQRYIRLNYLIQPLLDMVDEKKIAMNPAVELSYLKPEEQHQLLEIMEAEQATPSLSQAQRIKKLSQEGWLTCNAMEVILSEEKKPLTATIKLNYERIRRYFPKSATPAQMEQVIINLLEKWYKHRQQSQER